MPMTGFNAGTDDEDWDEDELEEQEGLEDWDDDDEDDDDFWEEDEEFGGGLDYDDDDDDDDEN